MGAARALPRIEWPGRDLTRSDDVLELFATGRRLLDEDAVRAAGGLVVDLSSVREADTKLAASVVALVPGEDVEGGEFDDDTADDLTTTTTIDDTTSTTEVTEETFITGLAGTVGLSRPSSQWIVPIDSLPGSNTTLWLMNTGTEDAAVTYEPLGETEYTEPSPIVVPAESVVGVPVDVGIGHYGYTISADRPISVAWEISGDRGVALVAGIASE